MMKARPAQLPMMDRLRRVPLISGNHRAVPELGLIVGAGRRHREDLDTPPGPPRRGLRGSCGRRSRDRDALAASTEAEEAIAVGRVGPGWCRPVKRFGVAQVIPTL